MVIGISLHSVFLSKKEAVGLKDCWRKATSRINMFAVVSASLKEWNGNDCVTVETNFPLPCTMLFILKYASHSLDVFADMIRIGELIVKAHTFTQRRTSQNMGINILRMTWTLARKIHSRSYFPPFFFFKWGEILSLTAVGNSKTVRHFQIVNVRRQSEFRGAKLNHSYPKCAVLLIRAPWKQSPWNRQK